MKKERHVPKRYHLFVRILRQMTKDLPTSQYHVLMLDMDQIVAGVVLKEKPDKPHRKHAIVIKASILILVTSFLLASMASPLAVSRKPMLLASLHKAVKK